MIKLHLNPSPANIVDPGSGTSSQSAPSVNVQVPGQTSQVPNVSEPAITFDETDTNVEIEAKGPKQTDFNFDDFVAGKVDAPAKPKESTEGDNTLEEVIEKDDPKTPTVAVDNKQPAQLPSRRDYSAFDAEEQKILKNLKNDHFAVLSKKLQEHKQVAAKVADLEGKLKVAQQTLESKGIPTNWYDHPEAYVLAPEFQEINTQHEKVTSEQDFYQQQLINVKDGKPWHKIQGYNQDGSPRFSAPIDPSNAAEVGLSNLLHKYSAEESRLKARAEGIQQGFKQQHSGAVTSVNTFLDDRIKALREEVRPGDQEYSVFTKTLPPQLQGNALVPAMSKMYGIIIKQAQYMAKLLEDVEKQKRIKNDFQDPGQVPKVLPRTGNGVTPQTIKLKNGQTVVNEMFDINEFRKDY